MTEADIRNQVGVLLEQIKADNEAAALSVAMTLAANALVDLNRIANALETLASPPAPSTLA